MWRWDLFCKVVDNYGDIGTCWRLAQQLAHEHSVTVRLWVDNLETFACLCPLISVDAAQQQIGPIEIRRWTTDFPTVVVADVVIEAFACELPTCYIAAMASRAVAPVWINLEYLSAETWVDGCHLLTSPHPRYPLIKSFFFPGFTPQTGGLLRERDLFQTRAMFDATAAEEFWQSVGISGVAADSRLNDLRDAPGEIRISLFCYENPALPELLQCWADGPFAVRLMVLPGPATEQTARWFGQPYLPDLPLCRDSLIVQALPFLSQTRYDRLLWACDVNFVRGEDSFVRAQWAQRPFVWQIYPQAEDAHRVKLEAFLASYLADSEDSSTVRRFWQAWNGIGNMADSWPDFAVNRMQIQHHVKVWAGQLDRAQDLANNLICFASGK